MEGLLDDIVYFLNTGFDKVLPFARGAGGGTACGEVEGCEEDDADDNGDDEGIEVKGPEAAAWFNGHGMHIELQMLEVVFDVVGYGQGSGCCAHDDVVLFLIKTANIGTSQCAK